MASKRNWFQPSWSPEDRPTPWPRKSTAGWMGVVSKGTPSPAGAGEKPALLPGGVPYYSAGMEPVCRAKGQEARYRSCKVILSDRTGQGF
jgi:hypothetical protein